MAILNVDDCVARRAPGRLIRRIDKLMPPYIESKFNGAGPSYVQWIALKMVRDGVSENAGELAHELGITTGATTRLIDALEGRGLLARERGGDDRRVVRLVITDAGEEIIEVLHGHVVDAWNDVIVDFTQDEAATLAALLVKLLSAVERVTGVKPIETEAAE